MNTLKLSTRQLYGRSHPIGDDTENVCFNLPKRGLAILNKIAKPNRSECIRQWIAEGIQKRDTWSGLAFRAAIGFKAYLCSIFSNASADKLAEAFEKAVEAEKAERLEPRPNADPLIEDLTSPKPDGTFEPTK